MKRFRVVLKNGKIIEVQASDKWEAIQDLEASGADYQSIVEL